jgi:hypothetical protein
MSAGFPLHTLCGAQTEPQFARQKLRHLSFACRAAKENRGAQ